MARRNEETTHPDATRLEAGNSTVRKDHRAGALTPMEFNLLLALAKRQGAVVSRLDLVREVWEHASTVLTRTVDTHVGELCDANSKTIPRNHATS
jgi:DNA-binding response OmpR family regulator